MEKAGNGIKSGNPKGTVVVALPNTWLRLTVTQLLDEAHERYIAVETLRELCAVSAQLEDVIALIDGTAFDLRFKDLVKQLDAMPALGAIIFLMHQDAMTYAAAEAVGSRYHFVKSEHVDVALSGMLKKARAGIFDRRGSLSFSISKQGQKQAPHESEEGVSLMQDGTKGILERKFTRRSFIKGAAATAAAAGVVVSGGGTLLSPLAEAAGETGNGGEQVFCGVCRSACQNGCLLNVHIRNGKIVKTFPREFPEEEYNRICLKGLTSPYRVYNPERLKYPMRRVGARGAGQWEQISWEDAIKETTDKWKEYQKEYGNHSVGIYNGGAGNIGVCSGGGYGTDALQRLTNTFGAAHIACAYDNASGQAHSPIKGSSLTNGGNETLDMAVNSNTIIIWGTNPANNQMQSMHFVLEAKDRGAKLIVIDPIFTGTASKADIYAQPRPGTDGLLAYAMTNIVLENDWVDWEFVKTQTDMPYWIKEDHTYLKLSDVRSLSEGEVDGPVVKDSAGAFVLQTELVGDPILHGTETVKGHSVTPVFDLVVKSIRDYTPEYASVVCDVPLEQIKEIASIYAQNKPSCIWSTFGINNYVNAHYNYRAQDILAVLTGNLNKPGAYSGWCGNTAFHIINYGCTTIEGGLSSTVRIPFTSIDDVLTTKKYGDTNIELKSIFLSCGNPLGNFPDRNKLIETLNNLEFFVVSDINMNDTAKYADILLPASYWFEQEDIVINYVSTPFIMHQEKAIEPLYDTKPDFEIYDLLATGMGHPEAFAFGPEGMIRTFLDTDGARALGITLDNLRENHAIRTFPSKPYYIDVFRTATGKAQTYNTAPAPMFDYGQEWDSEKEYLPYWEPPHEAWPENELFKKYPFYMVNEKPKNRVHSQWWEIEVLEEVFHESFIAIHSKDAEPLGIKTGDTVKVYNDRGYVIAKARINNGLKPGVLSTPKGWEEKQYIDGHYQALTSTVISPVVANCAFSDLLVNIEKVGGK